MFIRYSNNVRRSDFDGRQCIECRRPASTRVKAPCYYDLYWYYCKECAEETTMEE